MNPITISNISIPTIGIPTIGIPSVGFPSASGGGLAWPAGLKESIKAIYDPAKQGMTNYDVIEAYVEDFTTWNYLSSRGSATVTTNKIIITKSFSNTQNIIEDNKSPYDDIKIYVTGISEDNPLTINQYVDNKWVRLHTYTTDGIYIVKNRNLYVGFGTYITDDCNITITQLPTSILKDLSGNGNHAYLYGGKGKLNSGMGVYKEDFTTWSKIQGIYELGANSFNWKYSNDTNTTILTKGANETKSMKVIIEGLSTNILQYAYYEESVRKILEIKQDGEYVLPFSESNSSQTWNGFAIIKNEETVDITITQIPDYPNQLCYDGMMYAVCYGFPILEDYTVMADRTWFDKEEYSAFVSNSLGGMEEPSNGAFSVEVKSLDSFTVMSFGSLTSISTPKKGITYQTKQSYNGISINVGTRESNDVLTLGGRYNYKNDNNAGNLWNGCHGKIIIADRSFTEDEITWLKDNWKKI